MLRYKAFDSAACDDNVPRFERMVNDWLESEKPRILHVVQSSFGAHVVVSVVYEAGVDHAHARVEVAAAVPEVFENSMNGADLDPNEVELPMLPEAELPY